MSTIAVNAITDAAGGNTATINGMTPTAQSLQGFRNRIINGDMRIDQRNNGASVSAANNNFAVDRFLLRASQTSKYTAQQNAGSVTPPAGFSNYLGATSSSAWSLGSGDYAALEQRIEGFNISDFAWGTVNAVSATLSFRVYSSLTGTFGGCITNGGFDRSYPFSYSVAVANTWTTVSVTIPGDTTGTWPTNSSTGLRVWFSLGVGSTFQGTVNTWAGAGYIAPTGATSVVSTSGATFYITGVQLEAGSVASPFERRPYGTELALCQRYYYRWQATAISQPICSSYNNSTGLANGVVPFPVEMKTVPTALEQSGTASDYAILASGGSGNCTSVPTFQSASKYSSIVVFDKGSGLTTGQGSVLRSGNSTGANAFLGWSAEL